MNNIISRINNLNSGIFFFILLCLNFLGFHLTSNEEELFAYAKQFHDPEWIPDAWTISVWPGVRLLFFNITGFLLDFFDFEQVAFWGRLVNFLFIAIPVGRLFKYLKISNMEMLLLFQVIFFAQQTFFAGEWIFGGFEPKTLAYIFILMGLGSLVKEKFIASVTWTVIGSYFHILVGGWFFIFLFIYLVIYKNAWSKAIIYSAVYIAILLPIIIYLYKGGVKDFHATALGLNVNEILAYYRSPHHLGLFKSAYYFFYNHLPGVLFTLSWFTLCIFYFRKINDSLIQRLNKMNIILFSMLLISLIIGIFDRGGWYIKYFPYRIGALSMLLVIIQTTLMLKKLAIKESFGQYLNRAILIICLPMTVYTTAVNFDQSYFNYFKSHPQEEALYSFIQDSTARESVVHLYQFENLSFTRKTRRDRYVVEKFFPMKSRKIREWYLRMEIDKEIQTDDNFFYLFKENSVIDYIISKKRISIPDSKEVFKNETYFVYKL